jgi:Glyoxalase-like domain
MSLGSLCQKLALVTLIAMTISFGTASNANLSDEFLTRVDHLVYATPDLDRGISEIQRLTGIRATPGGQHLGRGTRNALIALGSSTYLEVIAPDPDQPKSASPRPFGIDVLNESKLVTWAAKGSDLDHLRAAAAQKGVQLGLVLSGSRKRPDGVLLSWQYTSLATVLAGGVVPFFIDWGQSPHPAQSAASGLSLIGLYAEHPDAKHVQKMLDDLGLAFKVKAGSNPALVAILKSPLGQVELR